jgi:hypothetical protein
MQACGHALDANASILHLAAVVANTWLLLLHVLSRHAMQGTVRHSSVYTSLNHVRQGCCCMHTECKLLLLLLCCCCCGYLWLMASIDSLNDSTKG